MDFLIRVKAVTRVIQGGPYHSQRWCSGRRKGEAWIIYGQVYQYLASELSKRKLVCIQPSEVMLDELSVAEILNLRSAGEVLNLISGAHQAHIRSQSGRSEAHIRSDIRFGSCQAHIRLISGSGNLFARYMIQRSSHCI